MEAKSGILVAELVPDCASLHPGYEAAAALAGRFRSVINTSTTVSAMKQAAPQNTPRGIDWSMIQPNSSGETMPLILKPVETMPKARPAAPGGADLRTSMSREGAITPPRKPATVI